MSNKNSNLLLGSNISKNGSTYSEECKKLRVDWTFDPPDDVMEFIVRKLNWVDRFRLCMVSKNFTRVLHEPIKRLPWLMTIFYEKTHVGPTLISKCSLNYPSSSNLTCNFEIKNNFARKLMLNSTPCYSRHGWVALWRRKYDRQYHHFFLYKPYTRKIMVLPRLKFRGYKWGGKVAVSMDPTSLEYYFFFVWFDNSMLSLHISMYYIGDSNWSNYDIDIPSRQNDEVPRLRDVEDVVYAGGLLYCVLDDGNQLGILDVAREEWRFYTDCLHLPPKLHLCGSFHVAFFDGDLFLLHGAWSKSEFPYFWRFDEFLMQWVQQESLGNMALFVGRPSFLVEAEGELSTYANTIHSIRRQRLTFTSFNCKSEVGALYQGQGDNLHEHNSLESSFQFWIEPPLLFMSPN